MQIVFVKSEIEMSEEERKIVKMSSLKKKAINASNRFKNSFKKKGRRSTSRVMSVPIEDDIDAEDLQALDAFRQALVLDELLPSKLDDLHMMLRYKILFSYHPYSISLLSYLDYQSYWVGRPRNKS